MPTANFKTIETREHAHYFFFLTYKKQEEKSRLEVKANIKYIFLMNFRWLYVNGDET